MSDHRARARRKGRTNINDASENDASEGLTARATKTAKYAASSIQRDAWQLLDQQVENGAAYVGYAAQAARSAAQSLEPNAPGLASAVSAAADRLDTYADAAGAMNAEEVWDQVSGFTRRQPALVFGLAALAGFLAYRSIRSARGISAADGLSEEAEELEDA